MTDKKRNNGKRQIPSMDAKEFYEIFMRNHDANTIGSKC